MNSISAFKKAWIQNGRRYIYGKAILAIFVVALTFGLILFVPAVSPKIDDQFAYGMEHDAAWDRLYCEVEVIPATKYRIRSCTFVATVRDRYGNVIDERAFA